MNDQPQDQRPIQRRSLPKRSRGGSIRLRPGVFRRCGAALAGIGLVGSAVAAGPALTAHASVGGSLSLSPGRSASAAVGGGDFGDVAGISTFVVPGSALRTTYLAVQFRSPNDATGYRAKIRILPDGHVWEGFSRVVGNRETLFPSRDSGLVVSAGQRLNVEGSVTGTSPVNLSVRTWVDGSSKPGWQQTYTDTASARISAPGPVRVWAYASSAGSAAGGVSYSGASAGKVVVAQSNPVTPPTGQKPSAATTGVLAGTSLTVHNGDITVTKDGTVLDRMDIHGFVTVRAKNVKISNSIVRGGRNTGATTGLITDYGYANLVVENVLVQPDYPSVYFDGIKGSNFTARRVHVMGNVDSVKIHGDNVRVEDSLLESTTYYKSDPSQGGGPTHNDNIQILYGRNLVITGNTIRDTTNFAILGAASRGDTPNLVIDHNWLDGGHCTIKLQELNGWNENASVTNNIFGSHRLISNCAFQATPSVNLTNSSGNVYEADGRPVTPLRIDS